MQSATDMGLLKLRCVTASNVDDLDRGLSTPCQLYQAASCLDLNADGFTGLLRSDGFREYSVAVLAVVLFQPHLGLELLAVLTLLSAFTYVFGCSESRYSDP